MATTSLTIEGVAAREQAIDAARLLIDDGSGDFPHWTASEYVRGIVEVLADVFGADVDDHDHAKAAIWFELVTYRGDLSDGPTVRQTTCQRCGFDVEGFSDEPTVWRDRGGSMTCPDGEAAHVAEHDA